EERRPTPPRSAALTFPHGLIIALPARPSACPELCSRQLEWRQFMYLLYSALLAAALLLSLPYWILQMLRHGKYRHGLMQRLGQVPSRLAGHSQQPTVWFHAVSVGEVLAVSGLVDQIRL